MMTSTAVSTDDSLLPPPSKILRRGTPEIEDALKIGAVAFSLPQPELDAWLKQTSAVDLPCTSVTPTKICTQIEPASVCNESLIYDDKESRAGETYSFEDHSYCDSDMIDQRTTNTEPHKSQPQDGDNQSDSNKAHVDRLSDSRLNSKNRAEVSASEESHSKLRYKPPSTRFEHIIGHAAVKLRIEEVLLPIALPQRLCDSVLTGIRSLPASILLYGPPGCGKTQLAKAIAGEAQAAFLSIGPSDVLSKFVGESETAIRSVFDQAYEQAKDMESKCAVVFFDEIDALGQSRGASGVPSSEQPGGVDTCSRRILSELLIQLNRINSSKRIVFDANADMDEQSHHESDDDSASVESVYKEDDEPKSLPSDQQVDLDVVRVRVIVVAATNRPEDCDSALIRRFAIRVMVGLPSKRNRKKILTRLLQDVDHNITKLEMDTLADTTDGWSGSELESLTREAAMAPVRECIRSVALQKRRLRNREQRGGDSSAQESSEEIHHYESREAAVVRHFQTLRPVSVQDFKLAITFLVMGNHHSCDGDSQFCAICSRTECAHYDSSSDEDE